MSTFLRGLSLEQKQILTEIGNAVLDHQQESRRFVVTGEPGTGKSHLLKSIQDWLYCSNKTHLTMSQTALTAKNVRGKTIHSALNIEINRLNDGTTIQSTEETDWDFIKSYDVIILEEYYMIDAFFFGRILSNLDSKMVIVLFGDNAQFDPPNGYPLSDAMLANRPFEFVFKNLVEQHRQSADPLFLEFLRLVRRGQFSNSFVQLMLACRFVASDRLRESVECCEISAVSTNKDRDEINQRVISQLNLTAEFYDTSVIIENSLKCVKATDQKKAILDPLSIPTSVRVIGGAKVRYILTQNIDSEDGWVNGTMVYVDKIQSNLIHIREVNDSGRTTVISERKEIIYSKEEFEDQRTLKLKYQIYFIPLKEAFAVTAFSLQGYTLDTLFVQLQVKDGVWETKKNNHENNKKIDANYGKNKTFYVAVSRCRDFLGLLFAYDLTSPVESFKVEDIRKGKCLKQNDIPANYKIEDIKRYAAALAIPSELKTNEELKQHSAKMRDYRNKTNDFLFSKWTTM